ncbi:ATP-binding protein [Priestia megaterium]|uniref:ATP-binding protein n=1 Tax=Priestia megaterium TaxID=1404 RepID=UPI0007622E8E|nr:ATP-binding protein [Priestia megaterium]KWU61137.1 hypothetical protein AWX17_18665 [Priestia megaterium]
MQTIKGSKYTIVPSIDEKGFWEGIGKSFKNLSQAIWEPVDNSISNLLSNPKSVRNIIIAFERTLKGYLIRIEDCGTGISELAQAFSVGNRNNQTTTLNEHGYGMKNFLAFCDSTNSAWAIYTRTETDRPGTYRKVSAPYSTIGIKVEVIDEKIQPWPGSLKGTGTIVEVEVSQTLFFTLRDRGGGTALDAKCFEYLCEDLGFVYSTLIDEHNIAIRVDADAIPDGTRQIKALRPVGEFYKELENLDWTFEGRKVRVDISWMDVKDQPGVNRYYRRSARCSGAEIRLNGRVIAYNLLDEIWPRDNHPSTNGFLLQANIISSDRDVLPSTDRTKTALLESDPKTQSLYDWIRKQCPKLPKAKPSELRELDMFNRLSKKIEKFYKLTRPNAYAETNYNVYRCYNSNIKADMRFYDGEAVVYYEGKKGEADLLAFYQLLMYWDGAVADNDPPTKGILVGDGFSPGVKDIIAYYNSRLDARGHPYFFKAQTWNEAGLED